VFIGGLALFIPGPWFASYLFGRDFTLSVMAFSAVVNLHHFILDGAIWKLRDPQVRSVLTSEVAPETSEMTPIRATGLSPWRLAAGVAIGLLLMLAGLDQIRYYLNNTQASTSSIGIAAELNPYDSTVQTRLGRAYRASGDRTRMERAFRVAAQMDPDNLEAQNAVARQLLETGRYQEAYLHYKEMFANTDPDSEALMNFGALCKQMNRPGEAIDSFQRMLRKSPNYAPAHLLLAEMFDADNKRPQAIGEYQRFVNLKSATPSEPPDLELQNVLTRVKQLEAK
jgi:tetratricopeptide (TPR) repeat protein